jgi:cell division protease FtsH
MGERKAYSERTGQTIDAEIAKLLGDAHERVRQTLMEKRDLLDALAHALLQKETVDRDALDALIKERSVGPMRRVGSY